MFFEQANKRQVSMRNRSKQPSTTIPFTDTLRQQREEREQHRRQEKSALLLQRRFRGYCNRQKHRALFRQDFLTKLKDISTLEQNLQSRNLLSPSQTYLTQTMSLRLVRMCLFVNAPQDTLMVQGLLLLLQRSQGWPLSPANSGGLLLHSSLLRFLLRSFIVTCPVQLPPWLCSACLEEENGMVVIDACLRASMDFPVWGQVAFQFMQCAFRFNRMEELRTAWMVSSEFDEGASLVFGMLLPEQREKVLARLVEPAAPVASCRAALSLYGCPTRSPKLVKTNHIFSLLARLSSEPTRSGDVSILCQALLQYFPQSLAVEECHLLSASTLLLASPPVVTSNKRVVYQLLNRLYTAFPMDRFLCLDLDALTEMWMTPDTLELDYASKCMQRFLDEVKDSQLFGLPVIFPMISQLKSFLFTQSLSASIEETPMRDLFCILFERWSRQEIDVEDKQGQIWWFPPQANLTSTRSQMILHSIPMVIPFKQRVLLFQNTLRQSFPVLPQDPNDFMEVVLDRENLVEDALFKLGKVDISPTSQGIRLSFENEAGIGRGVFKEFLTQFCHQAFATPHYFCKTPTRDTYYPCGFNLAFYHFFGKVLGRAVCDGVLIDTQLSPFVINLLLGRRNHLHDLQFLDGDLYTQLLVLERNPRVEDLGLYFSVFSQHRGDVELFPGSKDVLVTVKNVSQYVELLSDFRLNVEFSKQIEAMSSGFSSSLCDVDLIQLCRMFSAKEFAMLIGGNKVFDVSELRANVHYAGGFHPDQPYIHWFWQVVEQDLTAEQKSKLLRFITSCSRPPLLGFASLDPKVTLYQVRESDRLPTSSTCVNLLKLPKYASKQILKEKLVLAIEDDSGFQLS